MKSEIRSMGEPESVDIPPDRPRPFLDPSQHPFRSALLPCPTPPRGFHKAGSAYRRHRRAVGDFDSSMACWARTRKDEFRTARWDP
jgi:hypothetical protein